MRQGDSGTWKKFFTIETINSVRVTNLKPAHVLFSCPGVGKTQHFNNQTVWYRSKLFQTSTVGRTAKRHFYVYSNWWLKIVRSKSVNWITYATIFML